MSSLKKKTSVINEQTAAYTLIVRILPILRSRFSKVIPIYYWATDEGSVLSQQTMMSQRFYVLALFPRRPKFSLKVPGEIEIKINEGLLEDARFLQDSGVAVIAAAPIVQSIFELDGTASCVWYLLDKLTSEHYFTHHYPYEFEELEGILAESEIPAYIDDNARAIDLTELAIIVHQMRSKQGLRFPYFGGAHQYRPIFFMLSDQLAIAR